MRESEGYVVSKDVVYTVGKGERVGVGYVSQKDM